MKKLFIPVLMVFLFSSCTRFSTPAGSKIQVSTVYEGTSYYNGSSHPSFTYYIEKSGEDRARLKPKNLIRFVNDNPEALRAAKSYKVFHTVSIASFIAAFGGVTYGILAKDKNENTAQKFLAAGLIAFPVALISAPIGSHKAKKSIKVYNGY